MDEAEKHYTAFVDSLVKDPVEIVEEMSPERASIMHMSIGISGEAGELLDAVKKHIIYGKPLDRDNIIEELGDLEFYMAGLRSAIGVTRSQVLLSNFDKLSARYPSGYSDAAAQLRADKS